MVRSPIVQGGELDRVGEYSEECMSSKKAGFSKYSKECIFFLQLTTV